MAFTNNHLLQEIQKLARDAQTKQKTGSLDHYPLLPTNPSLLSAFGDEHLPYSPYYSSGVSSNSCASSLLSFSSSSSVASAEDTLASSITNNDASRRQVCEEGHQSQTASSVSSAYRNESISPKPENCDYYGFQWPTQWVDAQKVYQFQQTYMSTLRRQARKWHSFLEANNGGLPPLCPKLKRHVRRGVPRDLRRLVWMHYSGASWKLKQNPGRFKALAEEALTSLDDHTIHTIDHELRHLFFDNIYFSGSLMQKSEPFKGSSSMAADEMLAVNPKLSTLRRILLAFHKHVPVQTLLVQGGTTTRALTALAGFMLAVMGEPEEEEVFWLLECLIFSYYDEKSCTYYDSMVLMQLVSEKMPGVWNKISSKQCFWDWIAQDTTSPVALVTTHWFLNAFIGVLPIETVVRVWDCFIVEGYSIFFRVALTIIKLNETEIDSAHDNIQVTRILQNWPRRFLDCDDLLQHVFSTDALSRDVCYRDIEIRRNVLRNRLPND